MLGFGANNGVEITGRFAEEMRKIDEGYQRMMSIIDFAF